MRTTKRFIATILSLMMVFLMMPSFADTYGSNVVQNEDTKLIQEFKIINGTGSTILVDTTLQLSIPDGYDSAEWSSSKTDIATVDETGLVKGVAEGTATITAKVEKGSASVDVTVIAPREDEAMTIMVQFENYKGVYNGEAQTISFKATSASSDFDEEKVHLKAESEGKVPVRTEAGAVRGALDGNDFYYEDDENAHFEVVNGYIMINPAEAIVTANDLTLSEDKLDKLNETATATVTGTFGEDGDTLVYSFSRDESNEVGEHTLTVTGDEIQGNYKVAYVPAKLTITAAAKRIDLNNKASITYLSEGKVVAPREMNPNKKNEITLTASGLDQEEGLTESTVMTVSIPETVRVTAAGISEMISSEVSAELDEANRQLLLTFKEGIKANIAATIPVIPSVGTDKDLSGSYVLVTSNNKSILDDRAMTGNGNLLNASSVQTVNGKISPVLDHDPVWVFSHVSGNYYTIRSRDTGRYLYIDTASSAGEKPLRTDGASEESAQKILVEDVGGGAYSLTVDGVGVNNFGNNSERGFGAYKYNKGANEKFKLISASELNHDASWDVSGTWTLYRSNGGNQNFLSAQTNDKGRLTAVALDKVDNDPIPRSAVTAWTFEHVIRDWYTVRGEGGYLNLTADGASLSGNPQTLLIKNQNKSSIMIMTEEFSSRAYSLSNINTTTAEGYGSELNTGFQDRTRLYMGSAEKANASISGGRAIITENSGGAVTAAAESASKLVSVPYFTLDNGQVVATDGEIAVWTFTQTGGNWYTIQAPDGRYLSVTADSVSLTSAETKVYVQIHNGKYRFTNGDNTAMNNSGGKSTGGYGAYKAKDLKDKNDWHTLAATGDASTTAVVFNTNGGSVSNPPRGISGSAGSSVTLPDLNGSKSGRKFIGWSETAEFYSKVPGTKYSYREVLWPGSAYTMKEGINPLYAIWAEINTRVQFGIRTDGVVQNEPGDYAAKLYSGHQWIANAQAVGHWVIDNDGTKAITDYYVKNNVTDSLTAMPTVEQIQTELAKKKITFDPETQYIHWYVLKRTGDQFKGEWHVDGVIRDRAAVTVSYNANVPAEEKSLIQNMTDSYQVSTGEEVTIGTDKDSDETKVPVREGYVFDGWNTEEDGSGISYKEGDTIPLDENLNLYAQWTTEVDGEELSIVASSDWPEGKLAFQGAEIHLSAELYGFEDKEYTLQWQHTTDGINWIDEPGANELTYTYILDDQTSQYVWRIVANDIRDKE